MATTRQKKTAATKPAPKAKSSTAAKKKTSQTTKAGMMTRAKNAVADAADSIAKPTREAVKAGVSTFLHEVANSVGGVPTATENSRSASSSATKKRSAGSTTSSDSAKPSSAKRSTTGSRSKAKK